MERLVLATIANRLWAGQRLHGLLEEGKKEWTWEAAEEFLDSSVYLATALVSLTEASKRRYQMSLEGTHHTVAAEAAEVADNGLEEPTCGAV